MTLLRDLSMLWSLFHILVLFIFLYESRYPRRKTVALTCIFMLPLAVLNVAGLAYLGVETISKWMALTCTVPSFIFFFFMAKKRDGKFLFTFSLVDTLSLEIIIITNAIEYYIPGDTYIFMFVTRLLAFPVMEWLIYKYVRKSYIEMQNKIKKGWGSFAVVSMIFYLLLILMTAFPTHITARPAYLPALALVLILMPLLYLSIYFLLGKMLRYAEMEQSEKLFKIQTDMMKQRVEQMQKKEQEFRIQNHDIRHRLQTVQTMASRGDCEGILQYVAECETTLCNVTDVRYCSNAAIDAVVAYYAAQAKQHDIRMELSLSIPEDLCMDYTELSIVISNALENAVNACRQVPRQERVISVKCVSQPQFMMQISNPYIGRIVFDSNGLPASSDPKHGIGSQSIAAFCEKYNAYCEYKTDDGLFVLRIAQM